MILVVTCTLPGVSDDDHTLFIDGVELTKAWNDAMAKAKVKGIAVGDEAVITWSGTHPTLPKAGRKSRAVLAPTKEYTVTYIPGD